MNHPATSQSTSELIERQIREAWALVDADYLRDLIARMVDVPSPTGDESALARMLTAELANAGLAATYQRIDDRQANAVGRLTGSGGGADLMLYAPIDTLTVGTEEEDVPQVGPELRPDMRTAARVEGDRVIGLGASNPKGHAACVVAAARAIAQAGVTLPGSLLVGLGAGGMPSNARDLVDRENTGQGNGCSFMLEQGVWADYAILAKPGWTVSWEEVGLCWFTVRVHGLYNYVGSRERLPYRNAVVDAARLIAELDTWFADYTVRHTDGLVAPQGQIASVRGGWERSAAICPEVCEFTVDLRISPRTTPAQARREFEEAVRVAADRLGVWAETELSLAIPGSHTDPESWVVRSLVWSWERATGSEHVVDEIARTTSGATDGNILRNRGIPMARIGMPRVSDENGAEVDFAMGTNAVSVANMVALTRVLIAAAIDTCGRGYESLDAVRRERRQTDPLTGTRIDGQPTTSTPDSASTQMEEER
jgi:acetylornithine deacetylase/succinyl-diaminopimelate desuccinylase-like protein